MDFYLAPPPMSPLSRLLTGLLAVLVLVGAFFFGLVVLALAIGAGLVAWLALTLRMWWLRRRWPAQGSGSGQAGPGSSGGAAPREGEVIEADYEVISRREDD